MVIGAVCRVFRAISKDNNLANNFRRNVNVCFIGSCGTGKSTLAGHLQLLLGETKQSDINNAAEAAKVLGNLRPNAKITFIASRRKADRERGVTSDNNYLHVLGSHHPIGFTLIDSPGHRDFFRNTLRGFLQSDMAVWVVDRVHQTGDLYSRSDSFCEAPLLIAGSNMRCSIVVVNKMDEREWSTSKFDEIKIQLAQILTKRRVKTDNVIIVPVSAATGWNIVHRTVVPPGEEKREDIRLTYQGPTLWEAIVRLAVKTPKKAPKKPFRMSVVKMWNTTLVPGERKRGVVLGTVLQGGIKVNSTVRLSPSPSALDTRPELAVWGIGYGKLKRNLAPPGCLVALLLPSGKTIPPFHKRGQDGSGWVAYNPAKEPDFMVETRYFMAQVLLFFGPSINPALPPATKFKIHAGYRPLLHFVSGTFTGQVVAIHEAVDIKTKKVLEQNPKSAGGVGKLFTMTIASKVARAIEPYSKSPAFGRFFLTDNNVLVGAGIVQATAPAKIGPSFASVAVGAARNTYSLPHACESCPATYPLWGTRVTVAYATPENKNKPRRGVCANCFFEAWSKDPTIAERAYSP